MNANFRRTVSRNYSGRNDGNDEIDAALDDLGSFSYLDGIPFELDRGIQSALETARLHMNKAEALLAKPLPPSVNKPADTDLLLEDIGRVERQVLEQLKQIEREREERKKKKDDMIKEYLEKKEQERIQAQKELEEQELKDRAEKSPDNQNDDNENTSNEAQNDDENKIEDGLTPNDENTNNNEKEMTTQIQDDSELEKEPTPNSVNMLSNAISVASSQPDMRPSNNPSENIRPNAEESISSVPVPTYLEPLRNNGGQLAQENKSKPNVAQGLINFSEFESESDPFETAQLQTLNDMQELASVFPQSSTISSNVSTGVLSQSTSNVGQHQYAQSKSSMVMSTAGNQVHATNQQAMNPFQYSQYSHPGYGMPLVNPSGQFNPFLQTSQGNNMHHPNSVGSFYNQGVNVPTSMVPSTNANRQPYPLNPSSSSNHQPYPPNPMFHQGLATPYIPPYQSPISEDTKNNSKEAELLPAETLKSSKSVGDLMIEIQKETEALMVEDEAKRSTREASIKKSRAFSQTPPPKNVRAESATKVQTKHHSIISQGRQNALDDWIPWPDIDGLPSATNKTERSENPQPIVNPLEGLSNESAAKCKQLHDMGFPLARLGKACRAIGSDEQKLINYCLFVDKILEDSTISHRKLGSNGSDVVEDVILIHSSDEAKIKKHLEAFGRLIEFGFEPPSKIHTALTECDLNYEKALEQMLK